MAQLYGSACSLVVQCQIAHLFWWAHSSLVERNTDNMEVEGPIPSGPTKKDGNYGHRIQKPHLSRRWFGTIGRLGAKNLQGVAVAYGLQIFCETCPRLANPARSWSAVSGCDVHKLK